MHIYCTNYAFTAPLSLLTYHSSACSPLSRSAPSLVKMALIGGVPDRDQSSREASASASSSEDLVRVLVKAEEILITKATVTTSIVTSHRTVMSIIKEMVVREERQIAGRGYKASGEVRAYRHHGERRQYHQYEWGQQQ